MWGEISWDKIKYLEAFEFNWDKIKHLENQRLHVFYFNVAIIIAFLSVAPNIISIYFEIYKFKFPIIIIPLLVISILSYLLYIIILKLNVEISACFTALQWISERLGWIKNMEDEEREILKEKLEMVGIKVPDYGYYKDTYINLGIPIPYRVHDTMTLYSEFLISIFSSATLNAFIYCFLISFLEIIIISFILFFISIFLYLHFYILGKVKKVSIVFKEARYQGLFRLSKE
jgi:hypothetical protein